MHGYCGKVAAELQILRMTFLPMDYMESLIE